jgi:disease resistance protein RPM1
MKALREVDWAKLGGDDVQVAREIGELQQLQVLSIVVEEEPKEDFQCDLGSSLSKACALRSLHLQSRTLDFLLQVSSPPPLLQDLNMIGPISRFPDWISSLKHFAEFSVMFAELAGDQLLDCYGIIYSSYY